MPGNPRGRRRTCDQLAVVINRDLLIGDRDDDLQRALGRLAGSRFLQSGMRIPVLLLMPDRRIMVPERPELRPWRKLGLSGVEGNVPGGDCGHYRRTDRTCTGSTHRTLTLPDWLTLSDREIFACGHFNVARPPGIAGCSPSTRIFPALHVSPCPGQCCEPAPAFSFRISLFS